MPQSIAKSNALIDFVDSVPGSIKSELEARAGEVERLSKEQEQFGTSVPQLYGSLGRFVTNPSTVSVETYKRMLDTDETLGAGVDFMNLAMIARWGEFKFPVPEIEKFVRRALARMPRSQHEYLEEMFSAEWAGFSTTEMMWEFVKDFDGAPAFLPKDLVTYAPLTIVFACDRNGNVMRDGVYQYQRYYNGYINGYYGFGDFDNLNGFRPDTMAAAGDLPYPIRVAADLSYLTVRIPLDKIIHCVSASTGKFRNPYGRSKFRRIYKNWVLKDAFLKMWLIAADRKGTPLVVGYAAANNTVLEQGAINGQPQAERADVAMKRIFDTIHNSSYIVLPGKKDENYSIEAVSIQGDLNVFKDGVEYFNRAIMRGLMIPPLVMSAGDGAGSFSLGQEHTKIFNKTVDGTIKSYKRSYLSQFIQKIIAYNFPRAMWEKHGYGDFVLEEFDPEIMTQLSTVFSNLTADGYMSPSDQEDLDHVREKMGMKKKKAIPADAGMGEGGDPNLEEDFEEGSDVDSNELGDDADPSKLEDRIQGMENKAGKAKVAAKKNLRKPKAKMPKLPKEYNL